MVIEGQRGLPIERVSSQHTARVRRVVRWVPWYPDRSSHDVFSLGLDCGRKGKKDMRNFHKLREKLDMLVCLDNATRAWLLSMTTAICCLGTWERVGIRRLVNVRECNATKVVPM